MTLANVLYALLLLAFAANLASAAYVLLAIWRVNGFRQLGNEVGTFQPPVSILKPLCGLDAGLYENLRSFCVQAYPQYQVIFGVRNSSDPAIAVVERLTKEFPHADISLVIDGAVAGPNLKISNLANMYRLVKYEHLILADSDIRVDAQFVSSVVAPFEDPQVGMVTCLSSASPTGGLPSLLASMFLNEWFLPSVLVAANIREIGFALGPTMALRRSLLERFGGFATISQFLADDYMLGRLTKSHGYKVVLSTYVIQNIVHEKSLSALFRHELRWARTIWTAEPLGYAFSFLMYGIPLAFFASSLIEFTFDWEPFEIGIVVFAILLRVGMHFSVRRKLGLLPGSQSLWLIPVRDVLCFIIWCASFFGRRVDWKGVTLTVGSNGVLGETAEMTNRTGGP